jgi:Ca2+-binding EF-hand superfamily protein
MGCTDSNLSEDLVQLANILQLRVADIRKLHRIFTHISGTERDRISTREVSDFTKLEGDRFAIELFSIFDVDGSAEVDFSEFVLSLWNFCTLSKSTLGECHIAGIALSSVQKLHSSDAFTFDLYDREKCEALSPSEVMMIVEDLYGKEEVRDNVNVKRIMKELKDFEKRGQLIRLSDFRSFVQTHQTMLYPAIRIQQSIQRSILGAPFWEAHTAKRLQRIGGNYISVRHFVPPVRLSGALLW